MTTTTRPSTKGSLPGASDARTPDIFRLTPDSERGRSVSPAKVLTSSAPLSAKEQRILDELALLFTVQEERRMAEGAREGREGSRLSKASLSPSQLADASFIYQHVDFGVLGRCVPGFVRSHLHKNGRYLPETFILRVNYLRRRRALGEDSTAKRAAKETAARTCSEANNSNNSGGQAARPSVSRATSKAQAVPPPSRQGTSLETRVSVVSG